MSLFRALLASIMDACIAETSTRLLTNLIVLIDALSAMSSCHEELRTKLLLALSSTTIQSKVWELVRVNTTSTNANCRTYTAALHREAATATTSLLLNLAISAQPGEAVLPQGLASALIAKQRKLPHFSKQCTHSSNAPTNPSISLFQQESTPFTGQHLQDWRDRLRSELESQNCYQRDSIVRSVAQICQDLETRCNTVEEPFRREKARSQELEQRIEELRAQVASLESQAADDRFHLDGLEDEKLGIADERDRISTKLEELRVQFEEANRDAEEALRTAQAEFNARELDLRSTILNHEEHLRSRESDIQELHGTVGQVRATLEHNEEELRALGERYEDLQTRLSNVNRQLDDERKTKYNQSEEILRLKERTINLEHQLQNTESELEAISGQLSDLEVTHQELKQFSEDNLKETEVKFRNDIEAAAARAEEEHNKLNKQLADALQTNQQLNGALDKTQRELQTLQNTFSTLETRAEELDVLCGEQEEELEELRTLRRNVLASMGLATQNSLTIRSVSRSQKDGTAPERPRESREHRRRKSSFQTQDLAPKAATAVPGFTNIAMESAAEASFASSEQDSQNGSTPKRQKPRPSFKVPTMQTPSNQRPAPASRSTSKKLSPVKRSALRHVSPNRRHTTVGFALSETEGPGQVQDIGSARKRRGSLRGASQEDFDMDSFLAGTPLTPGAFVSGTGRLPADDDVTTTEL